MKTQYIMKSDVYLKSNQKESAFLKKIVIIISLIFSTFVIMTNSNGNMIYAATSTSSSSITNKSTNTNNINFSPHNNATNTKDNHTGLLNISSLLVKPSSLEEEHKKVHAKMSEILSSSGNTSKVAKEVQTLLQPHFEKEEQLSIPVLGALQPYVSGTLTEEAKNQAIQISQQFKKEYPTMLDEHKQIVAALGNLEITAKKENRQDVLAFIELLKEHATNEEQITYPATIVIGDLLELKK